MNLWWLVVLMKVGVPVDAQELKCFVELESQQRNIEHFMVPAAQMHRYRDHLTQRMPASAKLPVTEVIECVAPTKKFNSAEAKILDQSQPR
ncbi:TapY2 family type IVa secretion system protein [Ferrimonas aestuarii]|uniref:Uncharacterized protein n=1 Tax=Ferrimonas aestuarii TaxID=2569539 RepID=A0A4U1BHH2_9GAMM|nr:TapY2 family type IVa secretion system protein [Ferrimonas aestuarii]TKB50199.1 hypothetical protein FCL42_19505 [Ferrimonas aestuarii]